MRHAKSLPDLLLAMTISVAWISVAIATRPLIPIDETRYVAVAWEMHTSGDYLVPHLNGRLYSHKPPLFFWLINAAWAIFGVHAWSARIVGPAFSLACVGLTYYLGRLFWPDDRRLAGAAALLLVSGIVWSVFSSLTMFDTGLCFFVLLFAIGLLRLANGAELAGVLLLGLALGGGLLQKGPAVFLHTLPVALGAPCWMQTRSLTWRRWYAALALAVLLGLLIVLAWAGPAIWVGGRQYGEAILWRQSAGRVVKSFAHSRPFWWYLPVIPALLFPWSVTWPAWRNLRSVWGEQPVRLCLFWFLSSSAMFSLLSGKQVHYLLPVIPFGGLLMSRLLSTISAPSVRLLARGIAACYVAVAGGMLAVPLLADRIGELRPLVPMVPGWIALSLLVAAALAVSRNTDPMALIRRVTISAVLVWTVINGMVFPQIREQIDVEAFARDVGRHQLQHPEIAFIGKYHGQLHFLGRLRAPFHELSSAEQLPLWTSEHPQGLVIMERDGYQPQGPGWLTSCGERRDASARRLELWQARLAPESSPRPHALEVVDMADPRQASR